MGIVRKVLIGSMLTSIWLASSSHAVDNAYTFSTLAGTAGTLVTSADGTGADAQFFIPRGVAVDSAGNVYVADSSNHTIRKVTSVGVTTVFAGTAGSTGTPSDSPAKFNEPFAVAVDGAGTVYVADSNNGAIRKITPAGVVSTLAGGTGQGYADGAGAVAKFKEPHGLALDSSGNIYVTDYENNVVRKVTPEGVTSTLAGMYDTPGTDLGQGEAARFMALHGIAVDSSDNIYVSDGGAKAIRKITPSGLVTSFAGGNPGDFGDPRGLAFDSSGNLYVADYGAHVIKKVTPAGVISTVYGTSPTSGSTDGTTGALFNAPSGISIDSANNLYVADSANNTIRKISSAGVVSTLAGLAGRSSSRDGVGSAAAFEEPYAVATDGTYVYVADDKDHSIRKISADGTVTTIAGKAGAFGSADGSGTDARFYAPLGIAADAAGNVYVADTGNSTIRKITPAGVVSTLAGSTGLKGSTDGTGASARFSGPSGVAVDSSGNVFVAEPEQSTLRKITPAGVVTTFAGSAGTKGFTDGTGTAARFNIAFDVAIDSADNLYVVDRNNHAIRKVTPQGVVTTLAGSGTMGYAEGNGTAAMFHFPSGVTADGAGNVYVADTDNQRIRKITPTGDVTTVAGGNIGSTDGAAAVVSFYNPKDVAADASGNLYVADKSNHTIRKGTLSASAAQTISFGTAPTVTLAVTGTVSATASSGLTVTLSSLTPSVCSISGTTVTALTAGTCTIAANQAGNSSYTAATQVSQDITISKATQSISFGTAPSIIVGATGTVTATASSGLTVTYTSTTTSVCNVSGSTVTGVSAGTCTIAANQAGNSTYAAATQTTQSITISATPVATQSYPLTLRTSGSGYGSIASSPSGISCYVPEPGFNYLVAPDCTESYSSGTSVILTATPSSGSTFGGWSGACAGSSTSCVVAMTEVRSVTVTFTNVGSTSDCIFNWAEGAYPQYFPTGPASATAAPYYYRYYPTTATFLATATTDTGLWVLGPLTGNVPLSVGPVSTFMTLAGCSSSVGAPTNVSVAETGTQTAGSLSFGSSSKLLVSWTAPSNYSVDHYEVSATEALMNSSVTATATASALNATLTPLKAATTYSVVVKACKDASCSDSGAATAVSATTPTEYWQLQGTGNSVATLTKPVSDGNARLSATRFGAEAGATANTVQFYYGPQRVSGQSVASSGVVSATDSSSYLSGFTSYASTSGIRSPTPTATSGIKDIMTGQGVPLSEAMGAKVRLFFESNDADGKTRIYYVDSVDGYVGRDFNSGSATTCSTSADYLSTGSCPATVVVGVEGDSVNPTSRISAARQNKVGWPTLTDWRWDGAVGTFMVYTFENVAACNTASHNHAYAVWNGTTFVTQFDSSGCPKMFRAAQAALPLHIGDVRYKMYFGDPSVTTGKTTSSTLPFVGPKKLIYADGRTSGNAGIVDYEDWEGVAVARNLTFLWPDNTQLTDGAEGYIDDFHFLTPTGSLDVQVLYMSITDGSVSPFSATAVLLNP